MSNIRLNVLIFKWVFIITLDIILNILVSSSEYGSLTLKVIFLLIANPVFIWVSHYSFKVIVDPNNEL